MSKNEYVEERARNFRFVQKIENMPENWEQIVRDKLLPMAYIIHDKDEYTQEDEKQNPEHKAGTLKAPHVHFYVYFSGKRTPSGVLKLFPELNIKFVEVVVAKNANLAYFLHLNNEDKHRYSYDELKVINGLRVNFADISAVDFSDVMKFAEEYNITRFSELVKAARYKDPPVFRYVTGHYALVCAYFADVRDVEA